LLNNLQKWFWKFRISFLFLSAFFKFDVRKEEVKFIVYLSTKICFKISLKIT